MLPPQTTVRELVTINSKLPELALIFTCKHSEPEPNNVIQTTFNHHMT